MEAQHSRLTLTTDDLANFLDRYERHIEELIDQNEALSRQIEELSRRNEELSCRNEELSRRNEELSQQNRELNDKLFALEKSYTELLHKSQILEEKSQTNSKNSSKPPSQDPNRRRGGKNKPSGKSRGGQKGHKGVTRSLTPTEEVQEFKDVFPKTCSQCGGQDFELSKPVATEVRQVLELPEVRPYILQYNIHTCSCNDCQANTRTTVPTEALKGYGPRCMGLVTTLTGELGVTKRKVVKIMGYFGIKLSLGTVSNIHKLAADLLKSPYEEIKTYIDQEPSVNADETSWYRTGKRKWLWVASGVTSVLFKIAQSRSGEIFRSLLGEYRGVVTSDRYAVYDQHQGAQQKCWGHLLRDFEKIAQRSDPDNLIGKKLQEASGELFSAWKAYKNGLITRKEMRAFTETFVKPVVEALLTLGMIGGECQSKTQNTCKNILNNFKHLWTYLEHEGVEPTNNEAERALRPAVITRKVSYGSQSDWGENFVERTLSVAATMKKQMKCFFSYIVQCFDAFARDGPPPSPF